MVKCTCINDKNRPEEISPEQWVKQNDQYRITYVAFCLPQRVLAFSLYEKPLDETNAPFEYFTAHRFSIDIKDLYAFVELCNECKELDGLDIGQLMKESNLVVVD